MIQGNKDMINAGLGKTPREPGFPRVNPVNFSKTGIPGENYIVYYDREQVYHILQPQKNFPRVVPGTLHFYQGNLHFLKNKFAQLWININSNVLIIQVQ